MNDHVRRGTKGLIRDINNSRVLQIIQARAPISRAEIAKLAKLPPPTVTNIVNDFLQAGLVRETDLVREPSDGVTTLGRRPIMLTLNEQAGFAIGVKMRPDGLTVAITDLSGNPLYHVDRPLEMNGPPEVLKRLAAEVHDALARARIDEAKALGLGIGMPGLIDHVRGVCRYSSLLAWADVDVKAALEGLLSMPVSVDNDVNMLTAAEIAYGAGREVNDFLTVSIGRGIGLGIVMHGEIYRGAFGGAGEFGHTKTNGELRCECGAVGCLEAVASEAGICAQVAASRGEEAIGIERAIALGNAGDLVVRGIFEHAGRALGCGIGNLLNLFNPRLVIVTGEGTRAGGLLLDPMRQAVREAAFALLGEDTRIVVQTWGDEAWARGAASIVVHQMLQPPIYESRATGPLAHLLDRVPR
jgi:predicted NBD/HSP70 family sugar kinase